MIKKVIEDFIEKYKKINFIKKKKKIGKFINKRNIIKLNLAFFISLYIKYIYIIKKYKNIKRIATILLNTEKINNIALLTPELLKRSLIIDSKNIK